MNALLFAATVLIWGTTWIAIALQVGPVPVLVSIFYRFATAAALFLAALALSGRLKVPDRRHPPKSTARHKAEDGNPHHIAAPMAGLISQVTVQAGADIKVGDVIVAADGVRVRRLADLAAALEKKGVGGKVKLTLVRDGRRIDVDVDVADSATLQPG